jgi:hypothetical protein
MRFYIKNKRVHITILLTVVFSLLFIHITKAVTAEPGTPEDPLVSQSYVDSKIAAITNELNNLKQSVQNSTQIASLETRVKALETDVAALKQQTPDGQTAQGAKYEVIGPLQPGKQIITGESTEIVLRSGAASAISSEKGGVADLISGADLIMGQNVPLNHLLLVPRNDGRGITITGNNEAWVLIRGSYTIR